MKHLSDIIVSVEHTLQPEFNQDLFHLRKNTTKPFKQLCANQGASVDKTRHPGSELSGPIIFFNEELVPLRLTCSQCDC